MSAVDRAREAWDTAGRPGDPDQTFADLDVATIQVPRSTRDGLEEERHRLAGNKATIGDALLLYTLVSVWDIAKLIEAP